MLDWLSDTNFLFFTNVEQRETQVLIQTVITASAGLIGAIFGAVATDHFTRRANRTTHARKLNSLAISVLFKVSRAVSSQHSLFGSFFAHVPDDTTHDELWQFVLPAAPMRQSAWELSNEEFEFLIGSKNEDAELAYEIVQLINSAQIAMDSMNEYSDQRRALSNAMDAFTESIDPESKAVSTAFDPRENPKLQRRILETSAFCALVHNSILENIERAEPIVTKLNETLPTLTENPVFSRKIVLQSLPGRPMNLDNR